MKHALTLVLIVLTVCCYSQEARMPHVNFEGVRIWVDNLVEAERFYVDILGFAVKEGGSEQAGISLDGGTLSVCLSEARQKNRLDYEQHTRTGLTLQVHKLLPAIDRLRKLGVSFEELHLQKNGVGISIPFRDPAGNLLSLMEVQARVVPAFEGLRVYNSGITSSEMDRAIAFYENELGFQEWSRSYLPAALPLKHADGSFAFMLHAKPGLAARQQVYGVESDINLVFSTDDLAKAKEYLRAKGHEIKPTRNHKGLAVKDPFGNYCEIVEK